VRNFIDWLIKKGKPLVLMPVAFFVSLVLFRWFLAGFRNGLRWLKG